MAKYKFYLIISFTLLFQSVIMAQNDWVWVGPDSTSVSFVYAKDDTVYVRSAKNYRSIDGGQTWDLLDDTNPEFGGGFSIRGVYAKNSNIIYVMDYLGNPWKSINGGISWDTLLPEGAPWPEEAWIKKIYFSPHNHNVLFCIVREGSVSSIDRLYRTTNNGTTWENLGAFLVSSHGNELSFAFDPVDSMKLYVSGYDNYLYSAFFASSNFGDTWSVLSSNVSTEWILVDWNNNNRIYLFAYPMRSEDGGNNWTYITNGMPAISRIASLIDPNDSSILYASTNLGIYRTINFGELWVLMEGSETIDLSFSGYNPEHLFIDKTTRKLYVGTKQGLYKYDLLVSVEDEKENIPTDFVLYQNYPNPFNPTTTIRYSIPTVGTSRDLSLQHVQLIVYDILGNEVATLINKAQSPGDYEVDFDASNLVSGIYVYQIFVDDFTTSKKMILLK